MNILLSAISFISCVAQRDLICHDDKTAKHVSKSDLQAISVIQIILLADV